MAFWFGITSMIRPNSLEHIPSTLRHIPALAEGTLQARRRSPRCLAALSHHHRLSDPVHIQYPNIRGTNVNALTSLRNQYLFPECGGHQYSNPVSRMMDQKRHSSTYCLTGSEYAWMSESAHQSRQKWEQNWKLKSRRKRTTKDSKKGQRKNERTIQKSETESNSKPILQS